MCHGQLTKFLKSNSTLVSSPMVCTVPSINAFQHNYMSPGVHFLTGKKGHAKRIISTFYTLALQSPHFHFKSQWEGEMHKIQGIHSSSDRNWGATFIPFAFIKCFWFQQSSLFVLQPNSNVFDKIHCRVWQLVVCLLHYPIPQLLQES